MRKTILLIALLLAGAAVIIVSTRQETSRQQIAVGMPAPSFVVMDAHSGQKVSFEDLRGKVVFVNFWASWCQPCKDEMPSVDALYKELKSNGSFSMVTVLYKDTPSDAIGYLKAMGYSFPVFNDRNDSAAHDFGVTGVPETYIIDKKGVLKQRVIGGADWNSGEAKSLIYALLGE